jgi:hypothetical protein
LTFVKLLHSGAQRDHMCGPGAALPFLTFGFFGLVWGRWRCCGTTRDNAVTASSNLSGASETGLDAGGCEAHTILVGLLDFCPAWFDSFMALLNP